MLSLSRKDHEKIVIGEAGDIVVTVLRISGNRVKFGIEAPAQIKVLRDELFSRDMAKEDDV